jgi:tetratricopeptide (TPR) repeat protein
MKRKAAQTSVETSGGAEAAGEERAPISASLPAEAAPFLERVRKDPTDEEAWDELDELSRATQRPEGVSHVYRETLARDLAPEFVDVLGKRAVAFHDEWFEDPALVIEVLRRVLELAPGADWAFERLSLLLTMAERWDDLLAAYDVALASCSDKEKKKALLDEAARIAKDFAGSTDRAISYLKQLVPLRPEDAQLSGSLERRLLLGKRYRDLIDVWTARLPVLSRDEVLQTRVQIAETWLERLGEAGTSLDVVREILAAGNGEAAAAKLLERIGTTATAPIATRRDALALLKERFAMSGRADDVVRAIELALAVTDAPEERIALRREASELLAEAGKYDEAVQHSAEWLVLSPTRDVRDTLRSLALRASAEKKYADALVRAAQGAQDAAIRIEFLLEAGRVHNDALSDPARAIELYGRVLDDGAVDEASLLDVARRLEALLVGPPHEKARLSVLERLAVIEPDASERRRVLGEAARLAEELGDTDHALGLWGRRLETDAKDAEALDATVAILEARRRWEALVAALERRHDASADSGARRADLVRIADVYKTKLDDLPRAIDTWRRVESEFGANAETMDALADLSAAAERWSDVTALLRAAARQSDEPARRAAHLARMGDVYRTQRDAPEKAVESYREALEILSVHEGARDGLRALLDDRDAGGAAVETLAKSYADAGEWQGTLELAERRIARGKDDAFRRDVLLEAASLLERRANDKARALDYVRRAFSLVKEPEIERELARLAEETSGWASAAEGYAEAIATCGDVGRRAELFFAHGNLLERRLGDFTGALASYGRVTELEPDRLAASVALVRVAGLTGSWDVAARALVGSANARGTLDDELVTTFDAVTTEVAGWEPATAALAGAVARAHFPAARVAHDVKRCFAIWHRDRRGDLDAAQAVLREAVVHEANPDTLRMLADLERRTPGRELAGTLLRLAAATGDDLDVLYEAGTVALHAVHDPELSKPILERVLAIASERWNAALAAERPPEDGVPRYTLWALEQLVQLRLDADDSLAAAELLESGARLPFSPEKARELRYRAAELYAEVVGDTARAVELCRGILAEAPDEHVTIAFLAGLYAKENRLAELLDLRQRELALGPPAGRRLTLRLDIARVIGELGGDSAARVQALKDNLSDAPGDVASIDALAAILEAEKRHGELHRELVRQAEEVQAREERRAAALLWARAGRLAEQALSDVERALDAYRKSVALEPSPAVLDALAAIHTARSEHAAAVQWLEKRLERTGRGPEELATYRDTVLRLSRAYRASGQEDDARRVLTTALAADPSATELRQFLSELYREKEDWALLAPLLAEGVEYASDPAEKVGLLRQAAQVQRRRLRSLEAAIPLLEHAAALAPEDRSVRLALADALRSAGRFSEAKSLLEAMLAEFGRRRTPERAAVHYHLARIAEAEGDLDQALAQLEAASSIERSDPRILRLLGNVARKKGNLDAAERAYRALLLIVRRQHVVPGSDDADEEPVAASEVMFDLHQMAVEQGQSDRANDLLESAFETAASNNVEALRLERALRTAGQLDLVLRVLETRLDRITDPSAAAEILVARADLYAETGRLDEALDSLFEALGKQPGSVPLLSSAHDLAVRANALERYVARVAELASAAEASLASDLWMRLGALAESELADASRAADFFERSLATGRRALRAYRALLKVVPESDAARLARALRTFVDASSEDETDASPRNEALYRLAEIELASPETREDGARRLEQALDRAPDYDRALGIVAQAARVSPESAAVVRTYERVARAVGGAELLLDALTARSAFEDTPFDVLTEAVELARSVSDTGRLATLLERLIAAARRENRSQEVAWAYVDLAGIREASKDYRAAVELLAEAAERASGSEAFDLRLRIAELAAGPLDDARLAATTYESLRQSEPADVRIWKPLLEVYRRLGAYRELEACIAATVDAVYDPAERNILRMERGRILLEDPSRIEEAERLLREVLDEDPDHVQASVVLSDLLERQGRATELNELLDRQLAAARDRGDGAGVAAIALRMGKNLESSDRDAAVALYRESLEIAPSDRGLLEALLRLYGPSDDLRDRAFVMERLLELETGETAAKLALSLVAVARSLGDDELALRALRRGYEACPTSAELREGLVSWYTEREDVGGLADVFAVDARQRKNPDEAVEQFRRAASLHRERLGDPRRAAELLAEARAVRPDDVGLVEELAQAFVEAMRPDEALGVVSDAIGAGGQGAEARARLLALRARLRPSVQGNELGVLAASIADLDQATSLARGGYESELVSLLEAERELAKERGDDEIERAATMRLAGLLPKVGDQRRGLELLVLWVKRNPNDAEAVRGLGLFAANAEKWSAAAKAYQRLVEITDGADQIDAVVRLAEACERAGTPLDARPFLEQVYRRAPGEEMLRARLRRMYEAAGAYAELASIMIAEAEHAPTEHIRFERLNEAGDLSLRVEGGERTAIEAFRRAHELRPDDHKVTIKLADTLAASGDIEGAANVLDRAIDAFGKRRSPELSELQHAMARVGRIAGDWEAVFAWLDAAVQTDRQNGAAASDLAIVAMERGELDIAIKALQAITLLKNEAPMSKAEAYLRQGMIAEQKGDPKKAVFLAKRALTQEPDYADAKAFLERLGG